MEKRVIHIKTELKCVVMAGGHQAPQKIDMRFTIVKTHGIGDKADTICSHRPESRMTEKYGTKPLCTHAFWKSEGNEQEGYTLPVWDLKEDEVGLLSYMLVIDAKVSNEKGERQLGRWQESLADLYEDLKEKNRKFHFLAELAGQDGIRTAVVNLVLDMFDEGESEHDTAIETGAKEELPVKAGRQVETFDAQHTGKENLFASVVGFYLGESNPYLKFFGSGSSTKSPSIQHPEDVVHWEKAIPVTITKANRKVRIELWNDRHVSTSGTSTDEMLAQASIHEVHMGRTYWLHLYGGANDANFHDEAELMVKGRRPASTYRGSLAIHLGSRPRIRTDWKDAIARQLKLKTLTVRLYRGLYLDMYAGADVNVIVQLACAAVPSKSSWKFMGNTQVPNKNLLSFPGKVDQNGVLRFKQPEATDDASGNWFSNEQEAKAPIAWVERTTPEATPLNGAPEVSHAYIYIVREGQEDLPPNVFAKVALDEKGERCQPPKWVRVCYDRSVVKLSPDSHKQDDLAGFLLASASIGHSDLQNKLLMSGLEEGWTREQFDALADWCKKTLLATDVKLSQRLPIGTKQQILVTFASEREAMKVFKDYLNPPKGSPVSRVRRYQGQFKDLGGHIEEESIKSAASPTRADSLKGISPDDVEVARAEAEFMKKAFDGQGSIKSTYLLKSDESVEWKVNSEEVQQPKVTQPVSIICQPCTGDTMLNIGAPGELVRYRREVKRKKVFCHVDILAARQLRAADEDGLAHPCYQIRVENQVLLNRQQTLRSLDPTFMHRVVMGPFYIDAQASEGYDDVCEHGTLRRLCRFEECVRLPKDPEIPFPPILIRLLDEDPPNVALVGTTTYFVMGRVVIGSPTSLDARKNSIEKEGGKPVLNLNACHTPVWYALDSDAQTGFCRKGSGFALDHSWLVRPRLLLAVGLSCIEPVKTAKSAAVRIHCGDSVNEKNTVWRIATDEWASYRIKIDLLGLRHLPDHGQSSHLKALDNLMLKITSFWEGNPIELSLRDTRFESLDQHNPNFQGDNKVDEDSIRFSHVMKSLLKFQGIEDRPPADDDSFYARPEYSEDLQSRGASRAMSTDSAESLDLNTRFFGPSVVQSQSVLGWRLTAPIYTVPIIPYLQTEVDASGGLASHPPEAPCETAEAYFRRVGDEENAKAAAELAKEESLERKILSSSRPGDNPYVLMPDIVFQLKSSITHQEFGTHSQQLPVLLNHANPVVTDALAQAARIARVRFAWDPGAEAVNMMGLHKRDRVEVMKRHEGWAWGKKVVDIDHYTYKASGSDRTFLSQGKKQGWFPEWALDPDNGNSWAESCAEDYNKLNESERKLEQLRSSNIDTQDMYDIYIDVFAAIDGHLRWDPSFNSGRALMSQHLFTISPDDKDEPPVKQFFNSADWLYGDPRFKDEPFDWRVTPTIRCGELDADGKWFSTRLNAIGEIDERHTVPKKPGDLWGAFFDDRLRRFNKTEQGIRGDVADVNTVEDLEDKTTQELHQSADAFGYRLLSHQHAPEKLKKDKIGIQTEAKDSPNLHTFVREVGHVISRNDRDSRLLARLRLGLPSWLGQRRAREALSVEFKDLEGDVVSFKLDKYGVISVEKDGLHVATLMDDQPVNFELDVGSGAMEIITQGRTIKVPPGMEQQRIMSQVRDLFQRGHGAARIEQLQASGGAIRRGQTKRVVESQNTSASFLVIKFNQPGTVIWAPPPHVWVWEEPGIAMFVIEVDGAHLSKVTIRSPSFDLRFDQETTWFPAKTIGPDFSIALKRIKDAKMKRRKKRRAQKNGDGSDTEAEESGKVQDVVGKNGKKGHTKVKADGYQSGISVSKNAFCCRIRKAQGTGHFDRVRTNNWYRTVLSDAFPEVASIVVPAGANSDSDVVRAFFLSRIMNLRHHMLKGASEESAGLVKGHVTVQKATAAEHEEDMKARMEADDTAGSGIMGKAASQLKRLVDFQSVQAKVLEEKNCGLMPLERLWVRSNVTLNIYVLTVRDLVLESGVTLQDPYIVATMGGNSTDAKTEHAVEIQSDNTGLDFYCRLQIGTELPGTGILTLQLWTSNVMAAASDHLATAAGKLGLQGSMIGEAVVDLEDRWCALQHLRMKEATSKSFIKQRLSPEQKLEKIESSIGDQDDSKRWLKDPMAQRVKTKPAKESSSGTAITFSSHLAPPTPMPIETKSLELSDAFQESKVTGALRFWVDMLADDDPFNEVRFRDMKMVTFQVRLRAYKVEGISVYKDLGERNDVYIKVEAQSQSPGQKRQVITMRTDTHRYARDKAEFNWQWVFNINAPAKYASLEFFILDEDTFSDNDEIYHSKVVPLDELLMLAYTNYQRGGAPLGVLKHEVVFDSYSSRRSDEEFIEPAIGPDLDATIAAVDSERRKIRRRWCPWCFCCRHHKDKHLRPSPATLTLELELLNITEAELRPLHERQDNYQFSQPKNRLEWKHMLTDPWRFTYEFIGPTAYTRLRKFAICSVCSLSVLVILAILYLGIQTFVVPLVLSGGER
eukprot:TRINITY_DN21817_c0_g1_i1.p1 TRINITY_DN21817_c0_g1~~TRINITY_DN21817_c0_g1_i1.p1  ORF type:complete len:2760 (+),score=507.23 TRINITY_DN21817_c0_g1_i1:809-8281(+)